MQKHTDPRKLSTDCTLSKSHLGDPAPCPHCTATKISCECGAVLDEDGGKHRCGGIPQSGRPSRLRRWFD